MVYFYKVIGLKNTYMYFNTYSEFDSYMLDIDANKSKGIFRRLLDTTQHIKAPALMSVRFVVSSNDVLHSFALLSLGFKVDAVTGRVNEMVVFLGKDGVILGQCSELCGAGHYGMPIVLESLLSFTFNSAMEHDF
jgi:cytochrome c oxidase subunit 2